MNVKHLQKRKARRWMLLLLMLPLMAARAYAYDFSAVCSTGQTLYYNITDAVNHTVELTSPNHAEVDEEGYFISLYPWQNFQMPTGSITLPETVENNGVVYTVTSVGDFAFFYCEGLTGSLRIPNSVTAIGNYAFEYCSGFNSLTIGSSVTTIGDYAFCGCTGFRRTLSIPGTVTTIGNYAFYECSGFSGSLTIPNSVTSIGVYAFAFCTGFTGSLTIGNSVTTIGTDAFFRCTGFTGTLTIGSSVTTIGFAAFGRCTGFTGTLTIPNSVTTIDDYAFEYCSGLTGSLTIPNSVTTLGEYAFIGCTGFDGTLTLSNSLTAIRDYTFSECSNLTGSLNIPESVNSIGNYAFYECSGFTGTLAIPNSVSTIGDYAFYDCEGFTGSLTIGNSVTTIGNRAFEYCRGFTGSLNIPNSVSTIGDYAFYDCEGFTGSLTIPNSVTTIGSYAFSNCYGFTGSLNIPNSVTTISEGAFYNCHGFTGSLTIPNSVTTIGSYAFSNCYGFTGSLNIPNSVTTIGGGAFYYCSGFTGSLTIGSSVTSIGSEAFYGCSGFNSIISKPAAPPTAGSWCFYVSNSTPVQVPCGSTEAYRQAAQWSNFTNYSEDLLFDIIVSSSNEAFGTVAVVQDIDCDNNQATVQATPSLGYQFVNWTTDCYYFEGFEEGIPSGWAIIDADGDGEAWYVSSESGSHEIPEIVSHNGSCHLMSESYCNASGPLDPDNYLVMPRVSLPGGAVFSFWAAAQDSDFPEEHFGVAVSTGSQTNPNDFTLVEGAEWTITSGRGHSGNARGGNRASTPTEWVKYTVDLSAYAGQDCYIAIRHFNCPEQQALCIDDVELFSDEPMPVSDLATYSFVVTEDVNLTANFEPVDGYDIRVYANPVEGGTVTGAGIYGEMETVTLTATPNEDYRFVNWTETVIGSAYTTFSESFENGIPSDWAVIDADGDGYNWRRSSELLSAPSSHSGADMVSSQSYDNHTMEPLNPDNYLVSPQVTLAAGSTFSFWACAQNAAWAEEHFGVAISTGSQTDAEDFETISEWTMTAKSSGIQSDGNRGGREVGAYYKYTVDLSAYAGQTCYIAIRHFGCTDMYFLNVDDVQLTTVLSTDPVYSFEATSNRQIVANFEYIGVVHVTPDGTGDGSSWDNALSDIQEAINLAAASNPKPRVWVKAGTYSGNNRSMDQLTVYEDGTSTVGTLPMYGYYADAYTRSQYVIPATEIAQMTGYPIYSLTYHTTSTPAQWTSSFQVYLKEVNYTTMNSLIAPTTATTVYTGKLTVANGKMTIVFDTPYYYNGGNLLIGMDCIEKGNYVSCNFQAAAVNGAGMYAYNYNAPTFGTPYAVNYAPTTTFNFGEGEDLFLMVEGVNVYGGFAGNEPVDYDLSSRDFGTNETVLDGQNTQRVLRQVDAFTTQTIWDGFTIANGNNGYNYGGGAYLMANSRLQNCVFEQCQGGNGGAVFANGTEFVNCVFRKNTAVNGGAVHVKNGGFVNCLFANNQADNGGAVFADGAAEFINCDMVSNKAANFGAGIYSNGGIFTNCIVWGNESDNETRQVSGEGSFSYCAVETGISGENNIVLSSQNTGNGFTYPRFENPSVTAGADDETENVSWRLMENSACINHGNNEAIAGYDLDIDGEDRIQLDVVDLGCYESPYEGIVIPDDDGIVYVTLDGNGDGTSWENALNDIQEAMEMAAGADPKSMVWVAAGTYAGNGSIGGHLTAYANGSATVATLPMYALFADAYTRSQYVIPAAEIAQLTGYPINSLTYYTTSTPAQLTSNFQVYLTEVDYSTMSSLIDPTTATTVHTGKLTVANGKMTVVFDAPYYYNGGNLLIGMDCIEKGNYANCYFQAEAVDGAGMYAYNYNAPTFDSPRAVNYVPTTTFSFGEGEDLLLMVEGVNVYGGFAGNEPADYDLSSRDFEMNETVLDGQKMRRVLHQTAAFTTQTIWDGFTIANGNNGNNYGGGAYIRANSTLQNCVFENCQGSYGGAVYNYSGTLINCIFRNNEASTSGGAVFAYGGSLSGCQFTNNQAKYGGAVYTGSSSDGTEIENCDFRKNVATTSGGAVYTNVGRYANCLFENNQANYGGGVYVDSSYGSSEFINCNIVNNLVTYYGGGINNNSNEGSTFTNCIVWGNKRGNDSNQVYGNGNFSYCAVEGGISGENNICLTSQNDGNGYLSPRFENPSLTAGADDETENVSWRLMEGSACINKGNNEAVADYEMDFAGESRIQQDVVDMGCYESPYEGTDIPEFTDGIVYVTPEGSGDGTSWSNATNAIQNALDMASLTDPKPMVWVAGGTYQGEGNDGILYTMMEGINVYGGFVGNEPADYDLSSRDIATNLTVLDGQHERTVLRQANDFATLTIWDGFTIANGNNSNNDNAGGGASLMANSKLQNCVFEHCQSINWGGAVFADGAEFENCIFRNNEASYGGGAIEVIDGRLVNCLFANNQASYGGGVCIEGEAEFINCDIVNNKSNDNGSGVYSFSNNSTFTNCIIWGNESDEGFPQVYGKDNFSHCAVEGGMEGEGNIKLSSRNMGDFFCPQFENPSSMAGIDNAADNASWRLSETSICVNRGDNEAIDGYAKDLDGENRIYNDAVVDLGCYESPYEISNLVYPDGIAYVTPDGIGDGTSWDNAMNDIRNVMEALPFSESDPVVWVAAGTYVDNDGYKVQKAMTAYPDGTATVSTLPMYGYYANYYTRSQYVIPSSNLVQMNDCYINSLTYYTNSNPSQWTSNFQVYLKEVSNSNMNGLSLIDPTTATTVYTGRLSVANGKMTITFDTPYLYNGGNLLIGIDCLDKGGGYSACSFQAVSSNYAGKYAYNTSEPTFSSSTNVNYIPTTTFSYSVNGLFTMTEGLDVYGGFEGNEPADYDLSLRDFEANQTVLDAQNRQRVLLQLDDFTTQTIWDGFTLANGRAEDGNGGGALLKANSKLQNCVFENCQAYNGGAVYADGSEFENCIFRNDTASNYGGAVYVNDGGRFVNCLFAYNQAFNYGGAAYLYDNVEFINCDIVKNKITSDGYGGGLYSSKNTNTITNCIIWDNKRSSYSYYDQIGGSGVAFSYCAVQGGRSGTGNINLAAANDGTSTSYKYVRFVNPENGDFRLKETSACVNMGKPDFTPSCLVDLEGNPRIYGDRIDMGCYEFSLVGFHFLGMTNANWNLAANWLNSSMPSADDEAFIDANCVVNEDVDILKLTVSNGKSLSVPAGSTLTAGTLVTTAPAQLIIEDGGQLLNENNDVKGTVKKNINGYGTSEDGWYMIASPVTDNTNVTNLTFNTYNLFTFDGSEVLEWRTQHDNPVVNHKTGYLYANQDGTMLEFKGTLAGTADATVMTLAEEGDGKEFPGFNLIGNPYPCNAYITNSYYRMNDMGNGFIPGTGAIAPCEGIFVDADTDGQMVTFSKTPMSNSFLSLTVAKDRGMVDDRVVVRFDENRGLQKFMFNEIGTKLYIPQDDKEYAVVSAAESNRQDDVTVIPVNFKTSKSGTYTLSFDMENVSAEYIHFIDNLTGEDVDLLAALTASKGTANDIVSYTFVAKPSDYASRFKLVFRVDSDATIGSENFAYISNGNLVIDHIDGQATLQIIDVLGRVLNTEIVSGSYNKALNLSAGLYVICLDGKTQKIVVD